MLRAVIAWGIAALALLADRSEPRGLGCEDATRRRHVVVTPLAFGGVGAFLTVRVPGNPIGPMLLAATAGSRR